ncbi:MAG TPA: SusE domain-containing protein, partial [Flavisolibacter sp.]|nr:SusE domain-containing protein [Flavisolibacter sp.]
MKSLFKLFLLICGMSLLLMACDKTNELQVFTNGNAPVLTASATTVAPPAADSNKVALTLSWTDPKYATDSANQKFTIEIDSAGKNFSKAATKVITGSRTTSFTAKELNTILLGYGYAFNTPVDMDVRVTSSYANNNERIGSNTLRIKMTPYKIPPKVAVPASGKLFIVGGATVGGWNPAPVPSQEFLRVDETTFGGVFLLTAGQSYLLLPVNGDYTIKYGANGSNNSNNPLGDDFKVGGGDMLAPATGWYKLTFDFQTGKYTAVPFSNPLPQELYITGDATVGGWVNNPPVAQKFTRLNSSVYEITMSFVPG